MTTATRTTARDAIRAAADAHNWASDGSSNWHDRFIRGTDVPADSPLARFFSVVDFAPCDLIVVHYDDLGRVRHLNTAAPGAQSAITGVHVEVTNYKNLGRKDAALKFLANGVS